MKKLFLLFLIFLGLSTVHAQIPSNGLVQVFDGIDVPFGTPVGNVTVAEDRFGMPCAIEFDGELTSMILVQGWTPFQIDPDSSMSISLWYQGGSNEAGDLESLFIKYGTGPDPHANPIYGLQLYDLNTPLMSSPTWSTWADQSNIVFPDDPEWHHLVAVYEPGTWTLYMDNMISTSFSGAQAMIGSESSDIAIGPGFEGRLDDILFYNRALNSTDVSVIYESNNLCAVGLSEIAKNIDISIFPNPANELLIVDLKDIPCDQIRIRDSQGKVCMDMRIFTSYNRLDISLLRNGSYVLEVIKDGQTIGYKMFMTGC
jgi:hypothetical protein